MGENEGERSLKYLLRNNTPISNRLRTVVVLIHFLAHPSRCAVVIRSCSHDMPQLYNYIYISLKMFFKNYFALGGTFMSLLMKCFKLVISPYKNKT